jgi:tetratricopeptide (TPR) repeat protein
MSTEHCSVPTSVKWACSRLVAVWILLAAAAPLGAQTRVPFKEALTHVQKRVDPLLPPEAVLLRVGGLVLADVVIRADGTVDSVDIVSGNAMLGPNVIAALKQWTFAPFLQDGKPARVITLIEINFPDPGRDEARRANAAYSAATFECRKALESAPRDSVKICQEAVDSSRQLIPEQQLERSMALVQLGQALATNQRFAEALTAFENGLEISLKAAGPNDEGTASIHMLVGVMQYRLNNFAKSDEAMTASITAYEKAIERLPDFKSNYVPRLQSTLRLYAEMKANRNDAAAAAALNARANALRMVSGTRYIGPAGSTLTESDVRKIRQMLPAGAPQPWLIIGQPVGQYGELTWTVKVHLAPDFKSAGVRSGQLMTLSAQLPAKDAFAAEKEWKENFRREHYAQEVPSGGDPDVIEGTQDRRMPFEVVRVSDSPEFTNDEVVRIISFIREQAVKTAAPNERPRLSTDIQPWPIRSILRWGGNEAEIWLTNPSGRGGQSIRIRMEGTRLTVRELR